MTIHSVYLGVESSILCARPMTRASVVFVCYCCNFPVLRSKQVTRFDLTMLTFLFCGGRSNGLLLAQGHTLGNPRSILVLQAQQKRASLTRRLFRTLSRRSMSAYEITPSAAEMDFEGLFMKLSGLLLSSLEVRFISNYGFSLWQPFYSHLKLSLLCCKPTSGIP